jgi:PPK2 family polyphosphate:nucleotide phosphotransferase
MTVVPEEVRVPKGTRVRLKDWATAIEPLYESEADYEKMLEAAVAKLSGLQKLLYASNRYSLLLIFQAMDAAGKDGAIGHILSGVNPQGCEVYSFKHPSAEELEHDFLWRSTCRLPSRGRIGVFNRSYYEEVLIARVHPEILQGENLPEELTNETKLWKWRYRSIVELEKHLHRNGTRVIKFFLHLSKEEQRKRFLERIDDPDKNWKLSQDDTVERGFWKEYRKAYERCLSATSTKNAWHVGPADDKYNARLIISRVVIEVLEGLEMSYPQMTGARRAELQAIGKELAAERT